MKSRRSRPRMLGVPEAILPPDLAAFRSYVAGMIGSDRIAAAPFQKTLVRDVLHPKLRFVPRGVFRPGVPLTVSLLPHRIRDLYGLDTTAAGQRFADWSERAVRGMLPVVPRALRDVPQSRGRVV